MQIKKLISFFLLAAVMIFSVVYYTTHKEEFQLLSSISSDAILSLVFLEMLMILCLGLQVKLLTDHYALGLTFLQWFGLARMTSLANLMFGFAAGASVKAVYLKRFHSLKYGSFIAATGIAGIIKMMVGALFAAGLLLLLGQTANLLFVVTGVIAIGALFFLGVAHRIPEKYFSFWSVVIDLVNEWKLIRTNRVMLLKLVTLSIIIFVIYALEVYFAFLAFGITASFAASAVISAFDNLAGIIKLIPGNIGIKEAIFGMVSSLYGIGINEAVHAAVLHRVVRTAVSILVGTGFVYKLIGSRQPEDRPVTTPNIKAVESQDMAIDHS